MPTRTSTAQPAPAKPASRPASGPTAQSKARPAGISASAEARPGSLQPVPEGLCSTCTHAVRCLFVRAARQPIQFCEEFDDGTRKAAVS